MNGSGDFISSGSAILFSTQPVHNPIRDAHTGNPPAADSDTASQSGEVMTEKQEQVTN